VARAGRPFHVFEALKFFVDLLGKFGGQSEGLSLPALNLKPCDRA